MTFRWFIISVQMHVITCITDTCVIHMFCTGNTDMYVTDVLHNLM